MPGAVRVVGVDGLLTPKGWVTVSLRDGQLHLIHLVTDLDALLTEQKDADVIAVNLPLGHDDPDGSRNKGWRACDRAARDYLGAHEDLVEAVPPWEVFKAETFEEARERSRARGWPEPGESHWAVRERIETLNDAIEDDPRFVEIHPEVTFTSILRQLKGSQETLNRRPKSWPGQYERLSLLHVAGLRPMRSFGGVGRANPEDVLAATAAAWTANRVAKDKAGTLPEGKLDRPCIWH